MLKGVDLAVTVRAEAGERERDEGAQHSSEGAPPQATPTERASERASERLPVRTWSFAAQGAEPKQCDGLDQRRSHGRGPDAKARARRGDGSDDDDQDDTSSPPALATLLDKQPHEANRVIRTCRPRYYSPKIDRHLCQRA